jgi:phosphatidylglycerophosphate synthase
MTTESVRPGWIGPVPNVLTVLRLVLALFFPFAPEAARGYVVAAAGLSDLLDGWIARRFHAETHFGRLMDGIADKAFVFSAVLTLAATGHMPWWEGVLVMARDLVVAAMAVLCILRRAFASFRHMKPRLLGKVTTLLAFGWFLTLLFPWAAPARPVFLVLAGASSVLAALDYLREFVRLRPDRYHGDAPASEGTGA